MRKLIKFVGFWVGFFVVTAIDERAVRTCAFSIRSAALWEIAYVVFGTLFLAVAR